MAKPEFIGNTMAEGKAFLKENYAKGIECPCCKQFVKLYKRNLNSAMAWTLIEIYNETKRMEDDGAIPAIAWIHVKEYLRVNGLHNGHDWTLLQWWDLLEERKTDSGLPNSGRWRITEKGVLFVRMQLTVPKYISFYNSKAYGKSIEMVNIKQALGTKFNYEELTLL
jgi:hypothetical protein